MGRTRPAADTLAGRLRTARELLGLSQEAAGERIGLTRATVSSHETERTTPNKRLLAQYAELYSTTPEELEYGSRRSVSNQVERRDAEPSQDRSSPSGGLTALPHAITSHAARVFRSEFRLELTKARVSEELIQESMDLMTSREHSGPSWD